MTTTAPPRSPRPTPRAAARPSSRTTSRATSSSPARNDRDDARAARGRGTASRSAVARVLRPREQPSRRPELSVAGAPSRWSVRLMAMVALVLLFGAFFGLAAFHSVLVQNQLRIDRLAKEVAVEEALHDQLRLAYARQSSPDRMLAEAQAREMVQPTEREYLSVVIPGESVVPPPSPNPYNTRRVPSTTAAPATSAPPTTTGGSAATTTAAGAPTTVRPTATTRAVTPTTARPPASTAVTPTTARPPASTVATPTTARPPASTVATPTTGAAR